MTAYTHFELQSVEPESQHDSTIIFLHGFSESGNKWMKLISNIKRPGTKLIFPIATVRPVSLFGDVQHRAWFNVIYMDENLPEDEPSIKSAVEAIHNLLDKEIAISNLPPQRILLAGFSQGGALALYSGLTYTKPLAGIFSMSSWLLLHKRFPEGISKEITDLPILQCHGKSDPIIPYRWGEMAYEILEKTYPNLTFKPYEGLYHGYNDQELADIKNFVDRVLPQPQQDIF